MAITQTGNKIVSVSIAEQTYDDYSNNSHYNDIFKFTNLNHNIMSITDMNNVLTKFQELFNLIKNNIANKNYDYLKTRIISIDEIQNEDEGGE